MHEMNLGAAGGYRSINVSDVVYFSLAYIGINQFEKWTEVYPTLGLSRKEADCIVKIACAFESLETLGQRAVAAVRDKHLGDPKSYLERSGQILQGFSEACRALSIQPQELIDFWNKKTALLTGGCLQQFGSWLG